MRITPNPADTTFLRELRDKFAQEAYHYADQMMEARKRSP